MAVGDRVGGWVGQLLDELRENTVNFNKMHQASGCGWIFFSILYIGSNKIK